MQTGRPAKTKRSQFGERLHGLREAAGLSQAQVAAKLGIAQPTYALWERRTGAIPAPQLHKLAETFGVGIEALFGEPARGGRRASGPQGKLRQVFERASKLPREQQKYVLRMVEDALTAYEIRRAG